MDKYFIIEFTDGVETGKSLGYKDRRTAEYIGRLKEKANPDKTYRLQLQKETSSPF